MKTAILAVLGFAVPGIALAQSPTYEVQGFPLSLHQAQVMGFAETREQVPAPSLEYKGFPASPTQMTVLTRPAASPKSVAIDRRDEVIGNESAWLLRVSQP